jgi:NADH:ubiquinone oxidoreductase subunit F (NADH-binding)
VQQVFSFAAYESCGECTPCRLGGRRGEEIFRDIVRAGPVKRVVRTEWEEIADALRMASLCGFGTGLAEFAESVRLHYGAELEECFV